MELPAIFMIIIGITLKPAHAEEMQDLRPRNIILNPNVTGILGEEVYLHCLYTGENEIMFSSWNRMDSSGTSRKLAGYRYNNVPFKKEIFGIPASSTNLTVKVNVSSLDLEGEYTCVFNSDDDETKAIMSFTVIVRPEIDITLKEEVVNGTFFQAVSCSAHSGKPEAVIRWEIAGAPPQNYISEEVIRSLHPNGTTTLTRILHVPFFANNESMGRCIIEHPAFAEDRRENVEIETFVVPVITMETILIQQGENDFQEVTCVAAGGKPHPNVTWMLPTFKREPPLKIHASRNNSVISSYRFPSNFYEGEKITCLFKYTFLPLTFSRNLTLPVYYLSSLHLLDHRHSTDGRNQTLTLEEGDKDITIRMNVIGNVPRYKLNCSKEGLHLPEDVEMVGSSMFIKGPVQVNVTGQYLCQASYHKNTASLLFTIKVQPKIPVSETFPPNISMIYQENSDHIYIECLAFNASPAANVSWLLPREMNSSVQSDTTSYSGSFSVKSALHVPRCMAKKYVIQCIIQHPCLDQEERRRISLPVCAPLNATLRSSVEWSDGVAYARLLCSVKSDSLPALITWTTENCSLDIISPELLMTQSEILPSHSAVSQSAAQLPIRSYSGCTVTCVVEHRGLDKPKTTSIRLPFLRPSSSRVSVGEDRTTGVWYTLCEYRGDGVKPNITWMIPGEDTKVHQNTETVYSGISVEVKSTLTFSLEQFEGQDLTCLIRNGLDKDERRKIHVPKYTIISVLVSNKTTRERKGHVNVEYRLQLQENIPNQKILLSVHGTAPSYATFCHKDDGTQAETEGTSLVFVGPVSTKDAGLYTCKVSYLHHMATVSIRVDVTSEEEQHVIFFTICISSATAITLVLIVVLAVLCKPGEKQHSSKKKNRMERESLAALIKDPRATDKSVLPNGTGPTLLHYSIVFDVKSTV